MVKRLLVLFLLGFSANIFSQSRLSEQIGNIKKSTPINGGYEFELTNAYARVTAYNSTTIRVRISKQKFAEDFSFAVDDLQPHGLLLNMNTSGSTYYLFTDSLRIFVEGDPFRIKIYNAK